MKTELVFLGRVGLTAFASKSVLLMDGLTVAASLVEGFGCGFKSFWFV